MKGSKLFRQVMVLATLSLVFSSTAIFSGAAAARLQGGETPVQGGSLRIAISEEPDQLDPARTIELLASDIMAHI
ncbi:MAG: hypothetical protein M3R02_04375 [Chloroflexota bacterium]|nr:hypothetical protein [Chloroflexota bacterium]